MAASAQSSSIPCNCNRAVLCFIPALLWVLILGEVFYLLTRIFVRFYSEKVLGEDITQTTAWSVAAPFITGLWIIFWALITQANGTSKSQFLKNLALIEVKNMFPGMVSETQSDTAGTLSLP